MNRAGQLAIALGFFCALGCAHQTTSTKTTTTEAQTPASVREVESFHLNDPEPPQVVDQELESIPTEMNERVAQWINYFQGKGRPHMERYLARSSRYSTLMKRILRENGLPEDLIYIALIESGFSSRATSRAAAVGYWQFIKGTGRRYGLEISALVDERRDPVLSTQAAAEYFKGLYSVFGSWYLAMASYNVGENRVKREVMRNYTRDFWELAKKRRFPKETVNYIPKFIAAKMIAKNPEKYGFTEIEYEKPIEFEVIKIDKAVNLKNMAAKMGMEYDDFKTLNPRYRGEIAPLKNTGVLELRVPIGQTTVAMSAAKESFVDKVELIADAGDTETYKIRSGDSLYTIARRYRTSVSVLRDLNDIKPGRKLRIGMRIQVPERNSARKAKVVVARREEKVNRADDQEKAMSNPEFTKNGMVYYIVQPGDTLSAIADDYDSSIAELRKLNRMGKGSLLRAGMRMRVPPKDNGLPADPNAEEKKASVAANAADAGAKSDDSKDDVKPERTAIATATESKTSTGVDTADSASTNLNQEHVVRRGENLTTIAHKYGVTIQAIRKANNLTRRTVLKTGSRLIIPAGSSRQVVRSTNYKVGYKRKPAQAARKVSKVHIVRRGENLTGIASKYGVTLDSIREKNALGSRSKINAGARLLIPLAEAAD